MFAHLSLSPIRLTAVVLFLLTNVACMNVVDNSRPSQIQYEVQLMYHDEATNKPVYHENLQGIGLTISLEENGRILQEDKTDYEGRAFLTLPNDFQNVEAKLTIDDDDYNLEKDIIIGVGSRILTVLYYPNQAPRFSNEQLVTLNNNATPLSVPVGTPEYQLARNAEQIALRAGTGGGAPQAIPAPPVWQVIWEETFDPPQYAWPNPRDNEDLILRVQNGRLRQVANFQADGLRLKFPTPCHPTSANIRLETDIIFINPLQKEKTTAVVMFHHSNDTQSTGTENYYAVGITNRGEYWVWKKKNNLSSEMITATFHPAIQPSNSNRLTIEMQQGMMHISINDILLVSVPDPHPLAVGSVWLGIEGEPNSVGAVEFDNLRLAQLQN